MNEGATQWPSPEKGYLPPDLFACPQLGLEGRFQLQELAACPCCSKDASPAALSEAASIYRLVHHFSTPPPLGTVPNKGRNFP